MDDGPVVGQVGDGDHGFEGRVHRLLRAESVLEGMRGVFERLVRIAEPEMEVERHIGVPPSRKMLEVGESAGGLEYLMDDCLGGQRFDLVVHPRQFLVIDLNQARRPLRDMRVGGEHCGNRFAKMAHLVQRQDRLIVKGRSVIGFGHDSPHVLAGNDLVHARQRRRFADVDRPDTAMRDRAAVQLGVQHRGEPQIVDILGPAGDLGAAFDPREGTANRGR